MENSKQDLNQLIDKYLSEEANFEERNLLEQSYRKASARMSEKDISDAHAARIHGIGTKTWEDLMEQIDRAGAKHSNLWPRILTVAASVVIVFLAVYFFKRNQLIDVTDARLVTRDVAPGTVGATLTLANGKKIKLAGAASGKLAQEAGVTITKSSNGSLVYEIKDGAFRSGKYNTLSTANGETYQVRLPDGSMVYLNAASSLTYATSLIENGKRVVTLRGEGYFEVFKDKKHPFIVKTEKQEVEVLGTHFNINSYGDEPAVATTLIQGSVKVRTGKKEQMLKPGEQSVNDGKSIKVNQVDVDSSIDWKNGDFNLDGVEFKIAMRKIARWYNMDVIYEEAISDSIRAGGWVSRKNSLSAILKSIEASGQVHFRIKGRQIYITK
ncbi:FecR domain-containing protein [Pedobacter sp. MR2016-19]|uniref:FecR family protein n=1 Tax=Pedobacter sp. MR2016-19 TaxID=2780089 RepID=UPI0018764F10|nr:FecR family protein [Pedobacter sp. MR2016-19]MBE5321191.1 FecR domain-containing protein [Pedobacter sp. MR2016-19]